MMGTVEEILAAVKALEPGDRQHIREQLELMDGESISDAEWEQEWGAEAERRYEDLLGGRAQDSPAEEVLARVRARWP